MIDSRKKILGLVLSIVLLASIVTVRTIISVATFKPARTNFATFWLPARMLIEHKNPYNETEYLGEHDQYGVEWRPNKIFPYPIPLAILLIPFGFFSISQAYLIWVVISQLVVIVTLYFLLNRFGENKPRQLLLPLFAFLFIFGPLYFTLLAGSISALTLLILLCAILLLEKENSLVAGFILALTILKPPQGLPILLLVGIWFLAKKDWKAIVGIGVGGICLFLVGLLQDPQWVSKFLTASQAVMDRTQGVHSNVWAFAYIACKGTLPCSQILGGTASLILLGLGAFFLWKNQAQLTAWEAFNVIIPIGFVSTLYLWAYDQILYIIPITWIMGKLVEKKKGYLWAFGFLFVLVTYSFFALAMQANTLKDLWSLGNTVIVLFTTLWLWYSQKKTPRSM